MHTPRLEIYPSRIYENATSVLGLCQSHGVEVACVTKVTSAHPAVVKAFIKAKAPMLADSRLENLKAIKKMGVKTPLLALRIPTLSRVKELVQVADLSLISSLETAKAIGKVSGRKRHKVILMVDVGDLREGVVPEKVLGLALELKKVKGVEFHGLGCNLACFGGVIPTLENTSQLVELANECREATGLELPLISGGNSSGLPLLAQGNLPQGVNHYRVGEAIVLGRNVINRDPWPGTRQDTFVAVGEVIEVARKPSCPIGERGQDAFGGTQDFPDRGERLRAIVNLGRQDVVIDGITPVAQGIEVLGGSSDHLILDVENYQQKLKVGDELKFYPGYGALLALSTSPYVQKVVKKG